MDEDADKITRRMSNFTRRQRRSANSWDYYVEVLVVVDFKMLAYHQANLDNYVLTLFSTVASIYRHSTLGASIDIVVVRLIVFKHDRVSVNNVTCDDDKPFVLHFFKGRTRVHEQRPGNTPKVLSMATELQRRERRLVESS